MGRTFALRAALLFSLVFVTVSAFAGNIIHVPANQPTIQAGINAANNGDTVLVDVVWRKKFDSICQSSVQQLLSPSRQKA